MITHCGSLFGTYLGSVTTRSHRQQSHRQHPASTQPFATQQIAYQAQQAAQGPNQMSNAIAGVHEQQQRWGLENQSMGPGSLNSIQHAQQQKLAKRLSASRPAAIHVDAASNSSSGSAKSVNARAAGSGSAPSSPTKRQISTFDRGRSDMPWLQGRQTGPVEKALQKNKIRCQTTLAGHVCIVHSLAGQAPSLHCRLMLATLLGKGRCDLTVAYLTNGAL